MEKQALLSKIKQQRLYFDGGMGTLLQAAGLPAGVSPETWNLSHPEIITDIHHQYIEAGANFITTNTFGLAQKAPEDIVKLAAAAMNCARSAVAGTDTLVAFDIGPIGKLLEPFGDFPFEDAYAAFVRCALAAKENGADLILIETMNDALETKAALLAVKDTTDLPVIVSNAYDGSGKLVTGATPHAMIAMLEALGADVIGVNCSLGPKLLKPVIEDYVRFSSLPIIVSPNAGLPEYRDNRTVFSISADTFAQEMTEIAAMGVQILGGCCGTTPLFIQSMKEATRNLPYRLPEIKEETVVSSYTHAVTIGQCSRLIGERINPTGKKAIQAALRAKDDDAILSEGLRQAEFGVDLLDVNAGLPDIDEVETLGRLIAKLQGVCDLPLQIDTANPAALEKALRIYAGKPLINSVNGKKESMASVFPLAKRYGAAVIALTLDEDGIPNTPEARLEIAKKIVATAADYGIPKKDIIVDPLALTISSDQNSAQITLKAIQLIKKELGVPTSLGVSNISFGLPARDCVNAAFFSNALYAGLDLAIMNPFSEAMRNAYDASLALLGYDPNFSRYIANHAAVSTAATASAPKSTLTLKEAVMKGLAKVAAEATRTSLEAGCAPLSLIETELVPALNAIGTEYEQGKAFLPQLLTAAEAASASFAVIKEVLPPKEQNHQKVVLATVKGDIHDIGKNIVRVLLENFGFDVLDLGKDVSPETIAQNAQGCPLVGLSALMTTTVPSMETTIKLLRQVSPETKIVVGGAVLNQECADRIGADFYAADAMQTVRIAQAIYKK